MRSMTGFGAGEAPLGDGRVGVEVRAVNHRFLDVRVRLPRELVDLAGVVEQWVRDRFLRGRIEVAVRGDGVSLGLAALDRDRARHAYQALCELRDEIAPGTEVPLSLLSTVPDLFVSTVDHDFTAVKDAVRAALGAAADDLDTMRAREGQALAEDIRQRLTVLRKLAQSVAARSPELVEAHARRLRERTDRLRSSTDVTIDEGRLEAEIALLAERIDISEELTRLASHCDQLVALLASDGQCGRRLDFLLQEMAREANTIGAKSPDVAISHAVVEMKAEIERMREQVQNVE